MNWTVEPVFSPAMSEPMRACQPVMHEVPEDGLEAL